MSTFGWCLDGHHGSCRGEYGNSDGTVHCECPCHQKAA